MEIFAVEHKKDPQKVVHTKLSAQQKKSIDDYESGKTKTK
jgi:hypothetical protein